MAGFGCPPRSSSTPNRFADPRGLRIERDKPKQPGDAGKRDVAVQELWLGSAKKNRARNAIWVYA